MPASLSVVIPTLNAASALPQTADALLTGATDGLIRELVISDGGSTDQTREAAQELGALWVSGPPGRGGQIARGIAASSAPWVLILHADTHLSDAWPEAVRRHMATGPDCAGYFRLRFRAAGPIPAIVAGGANLRSHWLGLPYGDQGLLISRRLLDSVGGYPELPLMEDVALARRLKRRLRPLAAEARTSAERYLRDGWARRITRNLGILLRYRLGADPGDLVARYSR
jgi:rSAM/selenodomain-associated transferase 2